MSNQISCIQLEVLEPSSLWPISFRMVRSRLIHSQNLRFYLLFCLSNDYELLQELAELIRQVDESNLAYLKRLNEFIYEHKHRLLKKNKKAEQRIVQWISELSSDQENNLDQQEACKYFMEVSLVL